MLREKIRNVFHECFHFSQFLAGEMVELGLLCNFQYFQLQNTDKKDWFK